jgi:hypothetical protein
MRAQAVSHDAWQVTSWLDCRVRLAEYYIEAGRPSGAARVAAEARRLLSVADSDHPNPEPRTPNPEPRTSPVIA